MSVANYNFVAAADMQPACDNSSSYRLVMRQQPRQARACSNKERERKPIDPPPVVQVLYGQADNTRNYLQSPYMFVVADLVRLRQEGSVPADIASGADLLGTVVGSLNKLRDPEAEDGGFFIFSDIYVKHEGLYRLRFTLFEINPRSSLKSGAAEVAYITNVWSEDFRVYGIKEFPGALPSTKLSRIFCEQGVRLKLRKEARPVARVEQPVAGEIQRNTAGRQVAQPSLVVRTDRPAPHFHPYPARTSNSFTLSNPSPSTPSSAWTASSGLYTPSPDVPSQGVLPGRYVARPERNNSFPPQAWMGRVPRIVPEVPASAPTDYRHTWVEERRRSSGGLRMGPPEVPPPRDMPLPPRQHQDLLPPLAMMDRPRQESASNSPERRSLKLPPLYFPPEARY